MKLKLCAVWVRVKSFCKYWFAPGSSFLLIFFGLCYFGAVFYSFIFFGNLTGDSFLQVECMDIFFSLYDPDTELGLWFIGVMCASFSFMLWFFAQCFHLAGILGSLLCSFVKRKKFT